MNPDKPLLYDGYSGAGGAAKGYMDAGFRVIGIDSRPRPQPRYIGDGFIQMDFFEFFDAVMRGRYQMPDAWHASPPCQWYSYAGSQWRKQGREYPDLVAPTREALKASGLPYVIENVPGAPLVNPTILNGPLFGLHIHRTRLFETNFPLPLVLLPSPGKVGPKMGRAPKEGEMLMPIGHFSGVAYAQREMGIDWMGQAELSQAIPPAYTKFIGKHLLAVVTAGREK